MSGGEALAVVGLIASVITIIDTAKEIFDTASDAKGLPKEFRAVAEQIPLVQNALKLAEKNIQAQRVSDQTLKSAQPVLQRCQENAADVRDIFDKARSAAEAPKAERLVKGARLLRRSKQVREKWEAIVEGIALLGQNQVFQDADTLEDIGAAIERLEKLSDEEKQPQLVADNIYAQYGSGKQYYYQNHNHGDGIQYNADTIRFESPPDFETHRILEQNNLQSLSDTEHACHQAFVDRNYRNYKDDVADAVSGTCQWLLRDSKYRSWKDRQRDSVLWISADPGCGKSVLCKMLIDKELPAISEHRGSICYFFFNDREKQDRLAFAICAILHQLLDQQPALLQLAVPKWKKYGDEIRVQTQAMLMLLRKLAADPAAEPIYCVLDALDECRDEDYKLLVNFLNDVSLHPASCGSLKIFVTSRWPYKNTEEHFGESAAAMLKFQIRAEEHDEEICEEIALVIDNKIKKLASELHLSEHQQNKVRQNFLQMENRTYLWAVLAMKEVRDAYEDCLNPDDVEIEPLPTSASEAYERILQKVSDKQKPKVMRILSIIIGARRPLTLGEMALALDCERSSSSEVLTLQNLKRFEDKIRRWCGLFVYIKQSKIYLMCQTAKDFLLANSSDTAQNTFLWKSCLKAVEIERLMGRICIEYLSLKQVGMQTWKDKPELEIHDQHYSPFGTPQTPRERITFFRFCAEHWTSYITDQDIAEDTNLRHKIVKLHDDKDVYFVAWHPIMLKVLKSFSATTEVSSQHTLACNGYLSILKVLKERTQFEVDRKDGNGKTALSWAVEQNQVATAEWLIQMGANTDVKVLHLNSALQAAAYGGLLNMVNMLLRNGARPNENSVEDGSPLCIAASQGNEKIAHVLITYLADVNACGGHYGTALQGASANGYQRIVEMLLNVQADVNIRGGVYGSALNAACAENREQIAELLLDAGASFNTENGGYDDVLLTASKCGTAKFVRMLFERGARMLSRKRMYTKVLYNACWGGNKDMVEIMLDIGADFDCPGFSYHGALETATKSGCYDLVSLLLDRGTAVDFSRPEYGAALQVATYCGRTDIMALLLDRGIDVNSAVPCFGTVLYTALDRGYQEPIKVLLDMGANVNAPGGEYGSPLYKASERGQLKIVRRLLDEGANPNIRGGYHGTPLQAASCHGHIEVAELLLSTGADVSSRGGYFGCALSAASYAGNEKMVRLLLGLGGTQSSSSSPREEQFSPEQQEVKQSIYQTTASLIPGECKGQRLQLALNTVSRKTRKNRLLEALNDSIDSDWYGSPLQAATVKGHIHIMALLLNAGADINAYGGWFGTALQAACYVGKRDLVEALIENGANVLAQGGAFGNVLQAASYGGHESIVQYLLARGVNPNTAGGWFGSALQAAAAPGHHGTVQVLIEHGADPQTQEGWHGDALHWQPRANRESAPQ